MATLSTPNAMRYSAARYPKTAAALKGITAKSIPATKPMRLSARAKQYIPLPATKHTRDRPASREMQWAINHTENNRENTAIPTPGLTRITTPAMTLSYPEIRERRGPNPVNRSTRI